MLQRIYGTCFAIKKDLDDYLKLVEEAKKRDHRVLGSKLNLFHIDEEFGAGLPLWHPKGETLIYLIKEFLRRELVQDGYQFVSTPHIAQLDLWKTSGHWNCHSH